MIDVLARVRIDAGATPVSAARAAEILDRGGSVQEAAAVIEVDVVETESLLAALARQTVGSAA